MLNGKELVAVENWKPLLISRRNKHAFNVANYIYRGSGNIGIGIREHGNTKMSKKENVEMALPIAMAFTPMKRNVLLQPLHQGLRFPESAK